MYKIIKRFTKKKKYDIIHVHTPNAAFFTRLALSNMKEVKIIYTAHGFHFYKGAPLINWLIYYNLEKLASRWTDAIITINEEDYLIAKKKFKCDRNNIFKINGIGVDLSKYVELKEEKKIKKLKNELLINDNEFVITVVAEFIKRKNHKYLIDVIKKINDKKENNIKILFVGAGVLKDDLKALVNKYNMKNKIYFLGRRNDVQDILSISDIIGLFSFQEGLPRILLEAMSVGKPIICSDIRGNNELVSNNENGILVNPHEVDSGVEGLLYLYNNQSNLKNYSDESKRRSKKYDLYNVLNEMDAIYKKVTNK